MIQRQVTAAPNDSYVTPSQNGVMKEDLRQRQTNNFFRNLGANLQQRQNFKQEDETQDYSHVIRLQNRAFNGKKQTALAALSKDAYRDYSMEQLKETPEYKQAYESASVIVDQKQKELAMADLEETLGSVSDAHTNTKAMETMDSLAFDAIHSEQDPEEYLNVIDEAAETIGYARAFDVAATEAISSGNLERATRLLDMQDPRMSESNKAALLRFKVQAEAAAAKDTSKYKADIGFLKAEMSRLKDPSFGHQALRLMEGRGFDDTEGYGSLVSSVKALEERQAAMQFAEADVIDGASNEAIADKYKLETADIKEVRTRMFKSALSKLNEDPSEYQRLLQASPDELAPILSSTINKTVSQLKAINQEDVADAANDPKIAGSFQHLLMIGDATSDATLQQALGSDYDDFVLMRMDYQRVGLKGALKELKERQTAESLGASGSNLNERWAGKRNQILRSVLSEFDMEPETADLLRPYMMRKLEDYARRYNPERAKDLLINWASNNKSFEYNGETVLFADRVHQDAVFYQQKGYEVDEASVWEKYNEYALKATQERYPALEEINLTPSPTRPEWFIITPTDGTILDNPLIHAEPLRQHYLNDPSNRTKVEEARSRVRGER